MALWKLTPIDVANRNWEASTIKAPAIIRAPTEEIARAAASAAFQIATFLEPGTEMRHPPWKDPGLVNAETIEDARWPSTGDVAILDPPHFNKEIEGLRWK